MQLKPGNIAFHPLIIAVALLGIFSSSLHPATSIFGGLLFLLTAWAIPTAINFLISYWLASQFAIPFAIKVPLFVLISALVGIAPSAPQLIELARYRPDVDYQVIRQVQFVTDPTRNTLVYARNSMPVFSFPLFSRTKVGGNEGCMCTFFEVNENATFQGELVNRLNAIIGGAGANAVSWPLPTNAKFQYLVVSVEPLDSQRSSLILDVFDGQEKTATFRQKNIPAALAKWPSGLGEKNFTANFYTNTFDLIVHGSFWPRLLRPYFPSYFAHPEIAEFLQSAVRGGRPVSRARSTNVDVRSD